MPLVDLISAFILHILLQIALALMLTWGLCAILTAADVLPADPDSWGYAGRTDTEQSLNTEAAKWIVVPTPS